MTEPAEESNDPGQTGTGCPGGITQRGSAIEGRLSGDAQEASPLTPPLKGRGICEICVTLEIIIISHRS